MCIFSLFILFLYYFNTFYELSINHFISTVIFNEDVLIVLTPPPPSVLFRPFFQTPSPPFSEDVLCERSLGKTIMHSL